MAALPRVAAVIYSVPPGKLCPARSPPLPARSRPAPSSCPPARSLPTPRARLSPPCRGDECCGWLCPHARGRGHGQAGDPPPLAISAPSPASCRGTPPQLSPGVGVPDPLPAAPRLWGGEQAPFGPFLGRSDRRGGGVAGLPRRARPLISCLTGSLGSAAEKHSQTSRRSWGAFNPCLAAPGAGVGTQPHRTPPRPGLSQGGWMGLVLGGSGTSRQSCGGQWGRGWSWGACPMGSSSAGGGRYGPRGCGMWGALAVSPPLARLVPHVVDGCCLSQGRGQRCLQGRPLPGALVVTAGCCCARPLPVPCQGGGRSLRLWAGGSSGRPPGRAHVCARACERVCGTRHPPPPQPAPPAPPAPPCTAAAPQMPSMRGGSRDPGLLLFFPVFSVVCLNSASSPWPGNVKSHLPSSRPLPAGPV